MLRGETNGQLAISNRQYANGMNLYLPIDHCQLPIDLPIAYYGF